MQEDMGNEQACTLLHQTLRGSFQVNLMMQLNCHIVSGLDAGSLRMQLNYIWDIVMAQAEIEAKEFFNF